MRVLNQIKLRVIYLKYIIFTYNITCKSVRIFDNIDIMWIQQKLTNKFNHYFDMVSKQQLVNI